ncbi:cupin domain-containing protein [Belnapia sp. T6]|uniref:Cupin domain-containing protein n=1 Tax=Belnapia mucosa TaxID=2804532 RepID=A0ABS1V9I7_9PROT|nr:cupin domain-containing protein [Belnapia mucosa]MBL6458324.1 cupin domain-containing protein [Belnapia mucosa]
MAQRLVNLTAAAERLPWSEVREALRIRLPVGDAVLEIGAAEGAEADGPGMAAAGTLYLVVSGFGLLRQGEAAQECTAGDLVFVPGGEAHRFERLDGELRLWRISVGPAAAMGERDSSGSGGNPA